MAAGDDKLPFDLSDPITFFDLIVEHLRQTAAGTGRSSKQPAAAAPLQKPNKKKAAMQKPKKEKEKEKEAESSTESVEINNVEVEKDKDEEAEEPENVPETNDHLLVSEDATAAAAAAAAAAQEPEPDEKYLVYRTGPLKFVFRNLSASEAENRRMIREGKRKLDYDDIDIHKPKKHKVRSCIHVACESSGSPREGAESTASAPSPVHRAAFNPIVANTDNNISSAAAVNCASALSAAKQAPLALPFDLNLPPPDEF